MHVFGPFTLFVCNGCSTSVLFFGGDMVLKLFDRRFATELRKDQKYLPRYYI